MPAGRTVQGDCETVHEEEVNNEIVKQSRCCPGVSGNEDPYIMHVDQVYAIKMPDQHGYSWRPDASHGINICSYLVNGYHMHHMTLNYEDI